MSISSEPSISLCMQGHCMHVEALTVQHIPISCDRLPVEAVPTERTQTAAMQTSVRGYTTWQMPQQKSQQLLLYDTPDNNIGHQPAMCQGLACNRGGAVLLQPLLHGSFLIGVPISSNDWVIHHCLCKWTRCTPWGCVACSALQYRRKTPAMKVQHAWQHLAYLATTKQQHSDKLPSADTVWYKTTCTWLMTLS